MKKLFFSLLCMIVACTIHAQKKAEAEKQDKILKANTSPVIKKTDIQLKPAVQVKTSTTPADSTNTTNTTTQNQGSQPGISGSDQRPINRVDSCDWPNKPLLSDLREANITTSFRLNI